MPRGGVLLGPEDRKTKMAGPEMQAKVAYQQRYSVAGVEAARTADWVQRRRSEVVVVGETVAARAADWSRVTVGRAE